MLKLAGIRIFFALPVGLLPPLDGVDSLQVLFEAEVFVPVQGQVMILTEGIKEFVGTGG